MSARTTGGDPTVFPEDRSPHPVGPPPSGDHTEVHAARDSGQDVIVKVAPHALRPRLQREAEVLGRLSDQRVVTVVGITEGPDHDELTTLRHGSITLGDAGLLDSMRRGAALVSFCDALAGIHGAGWAHGGLEASHVLLDDTDEARLCSVGGATEVGTASAAVLADDRDALARIVDSVLRCPGSFETRAQRRAWNRTSTRALRALAAKRGLLDASAMANLLRRAGLPGTDAPAGPDRAAVKRVPRRAARGRLSEITRRALGARVRRTLVFAAVPLALLGGALLARALGGPPGAHDMECAADISGMLVDCGDITIDDNVVTAGGTRLEVGEPGDVLDVGDWNCNGRASVVLLRPSTGELWEFTRWASPEDQTEASLVGTFTGALDLAEPDVECSYPDVVLGG
ncbi:MAG: hypothetical protein ACK5O2_13480 [Microthrixaceae bacterium]